MIDPQAVVEIFRKRFGERGVRQALAILDYLADHKEGATEETIHRIVEETA